MNFSKFSIFKKETKYQNSNFYTIFVLSKWVGINSHIFFFPHFYICYISIFRGFKKLICLLIRVTTDFMNIWLSSIGAKSGPKIGQKVFWPEFWKKWPSNCYSSFTVRLFSLKFYEKVLLIRVKARGGVRGQKNKFGLYQSPTCHGVTTFYGIAKSSFMMKIWRVKVGGYYLVPYKI